MSGIRIIATRTQVDGDSVNLQIVGKNHHKEKVLGVSTVIEKIWKRHVDKSN
ncbi:hypothetical protein PDIG_46760 [Penicillium digitatum PHI26]|uniref:Uncharacterized protein n=2 Tax=Penicillium digitatum TaxID=36651 RepID=K9GFK1_PEND2|nr:hypothetical protein PDIP_18680 [Penicillium digitatum Pd1]EKV12061.1 hypothetical protein PDIG_46760 [Penicillium digitatum PHI26]EKV20207.1 hypothetical protein PDIP_18680 [Penicillium digitatum Pd1]